jgi:hypothetical protein
MKAPETKTEGLPDAAPREARPSLWDALLGWGYAEPARRLVPPSESRWRLDEEDFSAEHGYEPGFEGRSEFEHGEFERWT